MADNPPFAQHFWPFYAMAMAPDGSWVVTGGGDGTLRRWDTLTGRPLGDPIRADSRWVLSVAVTPDGEQIISGGGDGPVRRWDARTGAEVGELRGHRELVWAVSVSPDGKRIFTGGGDGTVHRWNARTGGLVDEHRSFWEVRTVATSPDGSQLVYGGTEGTVRLWGITESAPMDNPFTGHEGWVHAVAVTPDGTRIVSGGSDGTLRRWDIATGEPVGEPITGHTGTVFAVAVTPREIIVSGGSDGTVRRWDAAGAPMGEPLTGHTDWVRSVHMTRHGTQIISCGNDGTIRRWALDAGLPVGEPITGPPVGVNAVAVNGGEVISASVDGSVRRWDRETGTAVGRLRAPDGWVNAITISPDGRQIVRVGEDGAVVRWDATTYDQIEPALTGHDGGVRAVAYTPDSRWIVTAGADGTVRRWDRDTGEPVGEPMTRHRGAVNSVVVTPGGEVFTGGSDDGDVLRWEVETGALLGRVGGHGGGVLTVSADQTGDRIVSGGSHGSVRVWDVRTGTALPSPVERHDGSVTVVRFSPDGERILSGGTDGTVRQWDVDTGEPIGVPLTGHEDTVTSLAFLDDTVVLSGSADGTVRRWDLASGTQVSAAPKGMLADVRSDLDSSEDQLDIAEDVRRIGAMLAALSVRPPLSVALLGDWGTGKSTFMRQLRAWLTETARHSAAGSVFASNVRQVTFNAWHYSDDHLWVGLIEHMFRELATEDPTTDEATADQVAELKDTLSTRQAERARLEADLTAIDKIETERGWFAAVWAPLRSARVARAALASGWRELRGRRGWLGLLVVLLGVVAVVLGVRFGQSVLVWVGAAVGVLSPVVTVWRKVAESTDAVRRQLLRRKDELDSEIQEADDELGRLEPAHRLDRLLAEISTAERYESFRGLTGRIHHDLRRLSEDLSAAREEWLTKGGRGTPPLQRIVLYVDDLDRCTPGRVVDVLQAVNLLLTMDLFMVVVAVDPRWLLKALNRHHRGLLRDAGRVSPLDYLDKIFHIPFALRPMGSRAGRYLRSMLPVGEEPAPPARKSPPRTRSTSDIDSLISEAREELARTVAQMAEKVAVQEEPVRQEGYRPVANPEGLRVRQSEQDFLAGLAPLLPTPRAVKKLANLYRLVRLSIPPGQLDTFLGDEDGGPYQAAALLLAALVGRPREARDLLVRLAAASPGQDLTEVLPDHLATLVKDLRNAGVAVHGDTATYRSWATAVARYGFETYDLFTESRT
jgi:WD40 repeat protein